MFGVLVIVLRLDNIAYSLSLARKAEIPFDALRRGCANLRRAAVLSLPFVTGPSPRRRASFSNGGGLLFSFHIHLRNSPLSTASRAIVTAKSGVRPKAGRLNRCAKLRSICTAGKSVRRPTCC